MRQKRRVSPLQRILKRIDLLDICRFGMLIILCIYISVLFSVNGKSTVPFKNVSGSLKKTVDSKTMVQGDGQDLKRYYGLNEKDYEDVLLYIPDGTMEVGELLLVCLKDSEQAEGVENAMEKRVLTQKENFEGYGIKQTEQIQNSIIETRGNYVLLTISPDPENVRRAFEERL